MPAVYLTGFCTNATMLILTNVSELHKIPITEEAGQRAYKALYYLGQFSKNLK